MIWLTLRQFRAQALAALGAMALLALYLVHLGGEIRNFYNTRIIGCTGHACLVARMDLRSLYDDKVQLLGVVLIAVPALIGIFWGAPLVTRELEDRTDRLVWNQSITRTRWLVVKLGLIGLATALVTGLFSLLLTWSASRYDEVVGERFAAVFFDARNIVPIGYGLFAFVLGTVVGMVARRTLPAMTITLAAFAALQLLIPTAVRQNLMPAVTATVTIDAAVLDRGVGLSLDTDDTFTIRGYNVPGGWEQTDSARIRKPDGTPFTGEDASPCVALGPDQEAGNACIAAQRLHFTHTYQPGSRYWAFQWIELSLYLALSLMLAGFGFLRFRARR